MQLYLTEEVFSRPTLARLFDKKFSKEYSVWLKYNLHLLIVDDVFHLRGKSLHKFVPHSSYICILILSSPSQLDESACPTTSSPAPICYRWGQFLTVISWQLFDYYLGIEVTSLWSECQRTHTKYSRNIYRYGAAQRYVNLLNLLTTTCWFIYTVHRIKKLVFHLRILS